MDTCIYIYINTVHALQVSWNQLNVSTSISAEVKATKEMEI
jgi:hypothetical protein